LPLDGLPAGELPHQALQASASTYWCGSAHPSSHARSDDRRRESMRLQFTKSRSGLAAAYGFAWLAAVFIWCSLPHWFRIACH